MRIFILLSLLSACGPPTGDPELLWLLENLEDAYYRASGFTERLHVSPCITLLVDNARVEAAATDIPKSRVVGFYDPSSREVVLTSREWRTKFAGHNSYENTLAHELGHAMGLAHSATGLMREDGDPACNGKEGACLYAALHGL